MLSVMDESKVYAREGEDIVIEKKMAPTANKTEEKGGMWMGPMVTPRMEVEGLLGPYQKKQYRWWVNLCACSEATLWGFVPQTARVRSNEIRSPTMIFCQKATRGTSMANLDGADICG